MPLLFSYGMLQQVEVQMATFGRQLQGDHDVLVGYEPSRVLITDPHVIATTRQTQYANVRFTGRRDSRVSGVVFEISEAELASADQFEADAAYTRISVTLASGREAWVYLHAERA